MMTIHDSQSSYKDPSGSIFFHNKRILRRINRSYKEDYTLFTQSGLYDKLVERNMLIPHREVKSSELTIPDAYKVIEPTKIPFVSYPYEWCFSQLKDAALLTLSIEKLSLEYGMNLKDASSFNIQFYKGKPIFIDTLSFETYKEGEPWIPYKQFCEQFLAPLALYAYTDMRLGKMLQDYMGSIPLPIASKLLPLSARFSPGLFLHIFLHGRNQTFAAISPAKQSSQSFTKNALMGLIESLEGCVQNLHWKMPKTQWRDYYDPADHGSYEEAALNEKKSFVSSSLKALHIKSLVDIGANAGVYSQIAASLGISVLSLDNDEAVVEQNYRWIKKNKEERILPLWVDITNPTPAIGWENKERDSFLARAQFDCALALALIHHLAIANNLPLTKIAEFFASLCTTLIIEFVPREDNRVQTLLQNRKDIFGDYTEDRFETEFNRFFTIAKKHLLPNSKRTMYAMIRKS